MACWSLKGGVGTTVFSALLALHQSKQRGRSVLAADFADDLHAALGVSASQPAGLADWWNAGSGAPEDALLGLATQVDPQLSIVARGQGEFQSLSASQALAQLERFQESAEVVVADCGRLDMPGPDAAMTNWLAGSADISLLVVRSCYLLLRKVAQLPVLPTGVVLFSEQGRALGLADVERVAGVPVLAEIAVDPVIARAVDAGLLSARLPRGLDRVLGQVG